MDGKVIEFPRSGRRAAKGRDAAFEMLADMLIECVGDVARLKARVDELEAERRVRSVEAKEREARNG